MSSAKSIVSLLIAFQLCAMSPQRAVAWDPIGDITKQIGRMVPSIGSEHVGKSISDSAKELNSPIGGTGDGEVAQSPTKLCKTNPSLPQCDGLLGETGDAVR